MEIYSTKQVASILECRPDTLARLIWLGKLDAPPFGPGHAYCWRLADIQKASWVINKRPLPEGVDCE